MPKDRIADVVGLVKKAGILRPRDLQSHGIPRLYLRMAAYGVQEHRIEGVSVRIFSPAKAVADCFRYRNKIGLDVALEALRECRRKRRATSDELWQAAKVCRVANVMRPYLESLS